MIITKTVQYSSIKLFELWTALLNIKKILSTRVVVWRFALDLICRRNSKILTLNIARGDERQSDRVSVVSPPYITVTSSDGQHSHVLDALSDLYVVSSAWTRPHSQACTTSTYWPWYTKAVWHNHRWQCLLIVLKRVYGVR